MKPGTILATSIGIAVVMCAIGVTRFLMPGVGRVISAPAEGADWFKKKVDDVCGGMAAWGAVKTITLRDSVEIKPTAEFAFAKSRVRVTKVRDGGIAGAVLVAEQAFDLRFGWDQRDHVSINYNSTDKIVTISTSKPHLLGFPNPVEDKPVVLYRSRGLMAPSADDMNEMQEELRHESRRSVDAQAAQQMAIDTMEKFYRGWFEGMGHKVIFKRDWMPERKDG